MSDLNTEISITANADGVEAGVGRAKKSLSSLGETAQKIGKNGADGMQALGAGADSSARKVDAATKNMVGSLQRQIAAMEAGDKTSRKYQETLARMRGVDVAALKPYLDQLDSLQNKTTLAERAQASFNSVMLKSAAVFATAGAIASYAKMINDGVDALNDLKDATGASIENISALEDVGKRAGASFDTVSTSLIKFNNVLSDAKPGSAAEQAIKALGLSIEDLKRLDPAEALRQTSVALNRFADDGDKARLVQELFGKSVKEVAPFLKDLAESGALVAKVTTEQAEQAEKFNKELAALGKNAQDASRALVGPIVSALNDVIAKFKEGREAGKSFLEIANSRYWSNIREFYGMAPPAAPSSGGASGSWGDGPDSKPSVGPLPDTKKPKGPTKAELSEYDKLIQRLGVDLPKAAAEAEAAQMGYNKAQAEFIALANSDVWGKFSNSQRANVAALFESKIASEQAADATRALAKGNTEAAQARERYLASLSTGLDKIRADITAQEDATARMGLSKEAIAELDAAKLEMLATDLELQAIKAMDRNLDQQTYDALKEQAKLYRDLAAAKKVGAAKETALDLEKANAEAAKKAAEDWQRASDEINRSLTDALLRGFESGKGFAKNFVDTMKNLFSTLVLRPIISAVVNPVAGAITGALGLAGAANAGTSALGAIGSAASGASFLGNAAGLLGGAGTAAGYGFSALMSGNGLGALSGGLGMLTSGGPAAIMAQGAGMIAGVLGPIALGIGALVAIANATKGETRTGGQFGVAFDGSVTNQRRGQTYTIEGQQFDRDFTNGLQTALKDGIAYRLEGDPVAQESAIREAVAGTASGINGFLKALGSAATLTGFSAGLETSGKGRGGVFAGGLLSTGQGFGESGKGDNYAGTLYEAFSTNSPDFKTALENFTLDLKQSTIQALQTVSDIPQAVQKMLKGVDAEGLTEDAANKLLETINAQIVGVNQFKDALKGMGLDTLAALSFDAAAGLAEVSGGFDKLLGNLQTYYTNFFTGEEQRANLQRSLAEQLSGLGLQLPDINASNARDQFRALVSAAEKDMSEAGRKTYATLLALSGAFASITEAAQTTTQTLEQQRQAYYGALQDAVSARNKSLQSQLRTAQEVESTLDNIFGILRSNVRELYGEVDGTRGMLATQGSAFIDQALAAAKKSGYLPDADKLAEAISAVRGGIDGGAYTTQFAADRDRLVLAGKLSGLQDIAGKQLTDAQKTVRALETQIDQNEQVLDYWKQQIDIASGTYDGILSVEAAVQQLSAALGGTGTTKPLGVSGMGGGSTPASGTGAIPRTSYGADEALTSFEKFKAWYTGLKSNADPSKLMGDGYQVPDWLRVSNFGADSYSDKDLFGSYLFFKNNPQYASDYQQIIDTGRSSYATDGSTLQRTDLSKLPKDIADYYSSNRNELLATEGFGLDPVLAYQLYNFGPGQFGLDGRKQSFTEWLQNTKWTPDGLVSNNNVVSLAQMGYSNYNLARWQLSSGNIVDRDGTIYTPEGKRVGRASQAQFEEVYGAGAKPTGGMSGAGDDYLTAIKTNIDSAINSGWSAQQLADGLISTGTSLKDVADAYGISVEQVKENLINGGATNIPKFAVGTNYVPRDMLAYIHEGEAVVPKAYNPAAGGGGAGGNAELVAEVRALREAVAALQAAANETAGNTRLMPQMGRQFDSVTLGGTAMRQKAVA